jgi:hypothetical protein
MIKGRCRWTGVAELVVPRGLPSPPLEAPVADAEGDEDVEGVLKVEADEAEVDSDTAVLVVLVVTDGVRTAELALVVTIAGNEDVVDGEPTDAAADFDPNPIRSLSKSKTV